jgi:hypothetical protein
VPALTCTGQPVDRYARPIGDPCGAAWTGDTLNAAAVLGWRIGPVDGDNRLGLCPRCVAGPVDEVNRNIFPDQLSLPGLDVQQL